MQDRTPDWNWTAKQLNKIKKGISSDPLDLEKTKEEKAVSHPDAPDFRGAGYGNVFHLKTDKKPGSAHLPGSGFCVQKYTDKSS
ncbi:MAG: hypothetical protein E7658_08850 [Ruminococcaceae bacterium]|nr:hypothetical protein [Oscillospiraceae bacterium]